jgi:hypothetical protein
MKLFFPFGLEKGVKIHFFKRIVEANFFTKLMCIKVLLFNKVCRSLRKVRVQSAFAKPDWKKTPLCQPGGYMFCQKHLLSNQVLQKLIKKESKKEP